jgi:hypothetical protein
MSGIHMIMDMGLAVKLNGAFIAVAGLTASLRVFAAEAELLTSAIKSLNFDGNGSANSLPLNAPQGSAFVSWPAA